VCADLASTLVPACPGAAHDSTTSAPAVDDVGVGAAGPLRRASGVHRGSNQKRQTGNLRLSSGGERARVVGRALLAGLSLDFLPAVLPALTCPPHL
jgi:thiol:disulfide interchange protein